ncbi:MAG TPA: FAD-dependent oxidoreductase [Vicinamibacterales bacterium]|nr:FAD-dependent oxidoreductase [Vicinamibacterales bacterium]
MATADVVVVGGGPGGFAAALQAARMGADTILVEKYDAPGGVHTSGLQGAAGPGVGGIHTELMQRLADEGYVYTVTEATLPDWADNPLSHYEAHLAPGSAFSRSTFNPEGAGWVMARMLQEAGVRAYYGTVFVDAVTHSGKGDASIRKVIVENVSGRQAIRGKVFVEGSGTAELVARAGAPFVRGGGAQPSTATWDGQHRPVPGALLWIMSGIEFAQVAAYQKRANDPTLGKLIATARAAGDIPPELYRPRLPGTGVYGNAYIGHPTVDMSPIQGPGTFVFWQNVPYEWALHADDDAADENRARMMLRQLVDAEAKFLKKYVPGFEHAHVTNTGRYVGVRDGRHPIGEYLFSIDDARSGRRFPDAVTKPMTKTFFWDAYRRYTFEVPYRCFLPKVIDNLLLTGASLSFTYETIFMVMRNLPWCTQTGEIAGYAAAQAVQRGITPKALEWTAPYFF